MKAHPLQAPLDAEAETERLLRAKPGKLDIATTELYTHVLDSDLRAEIQRRRHPLSDNKANGGDHDA